MIVYLGTICGFGFNYAPLGWAQCQGGLLSVSQYPLLFSLLGTAFGGNGTTTFGLPDLRGSRAIGQGTGPDYIPYAVGAAGGGESSVISYANYPAHNHSVTFKINANNATGDITEPLNNYPAMAHPVVHGQDSIYFATPEPGVYMAPPTIILANAGFSAPVSVDIRRPYLAINYCIALQGDYPARS